MRVIRIADVVLQYIFIFLFAGSLVAGVFRWQWFIVAGAAILAYLVWGLWRLRCPWCGGAVELGELIHGRRGSCHCPSCGHEITVVTRLGKLTPRPGSETIPVEIPEADTVEEPERGFEQDGPEERRGKFGPEVSVRPDATLEEAVAAILGTDPEDMDDKSNDPGAGENMEKTEIEGSISK